MCTKEEETPGASFSLTTPVLIQAFTSHFGLDFFVFENVPGLTQKRHHRRYLEFKRLCKKAGYSVREKVVNAGRFGIPQNRKRIIVIGINRERFPGLVLDPPDGDKQPTLARDALEVCRSRHSAAGI